MSLIRAPQQTDLSNDVPLQVIDTVACSILAGICKVQNGILQGSTMGEMQQQGVVMLGANIFSPNQLFLPELGPEAEAGTIYASSSAKGAAGRRLVAGILGDPSLQEEVPVFVAQNGKRGDLFARLGLLTNTAIHEVKNEADIAFTERFQSQALKYQSIAAGLNFELHYWFLEQSQDPALIYWLQQQNIIVHFVGH